MEDHDVFISYVTADCERVRPIRDALVARGLTVWLDETEIATFESITGSIKRGLAHCKVLVAFYSTRYSVSRACQWELTAAFLAAQRNGDPRQASPPVAATQGSPPPAPAAAGLLRWVPPAAGIALAACGLSSRSTSGVVV